MNDFILQLKARILAGGEITVGEALRLIEIEDPATLETLFSAAHEITTRFNSREAHLCSLVNAKSYLCGEDCAFCSQSVRYNTEISRYQLMEPDEVVTAAKEFERKGIKNFCVVTSGAELNAEEFEQILETCRRLKAETSLEIDGSLGFLTTDRAKRLREAGLRRVNNNLQTSREFYPEIVSTHTYEKRAETLKSILEGGLELCSGGLFGMGETREDRVRLAFELKPYAPDCLPVNILNARPGTPLESQPQADPIEMVKTIAVFRFIHPKTNLKLAGGREINLGAEYQAMALRAGANGLIIGGYLTTSGNPMQEDLKMLERAGFEVPQNNSASTASATS